MSQLTGSQRISIRQKPACQIRLQHRKSQEILVPFALPWVSRAQEGDPGRGSELCALPSSASEFPPRLHSEEKCHSRQSGRTLKLSAVHKGPNTHVPFTSLYSHTSLSLHFILYLQKHSSAFLKRTLLRGLTLGLFLNSSVPSQATKQFVPSTTPQKFWKPACVLFTLQSPNSYSATVIGCDTSPWNSTKIPVLTILLTCSSKISYFVSCSLTDYTHTIICRYVWEWRYI